MNVIFHRYLGHSLKNGRSGIIEKLKNSKYATLEINLPYLFDYKIKYVIIFRMLRCKKEKPEAIDEVIEKMDTAGEEFQSLLSDAEEKD